MLKLGSAYFRAFLDSIDKTPAPASATFKYEYVTIQDTPDDVPSLEVAAKVGYFPLFIFLVEILSIHWWYTRGVQ